MGELHVAVDPPDSKIMERPEQEVHIPQPVPDAVVGQHRPQVPVSYQVLLAGQKVGDQLLSALV